jgi:hypothetical protein
MVLIAYWAIVLVIAAFSLRMACGICRTDLPSWKRAFVSVVVVTFTSCTFQFSAAGSANPAEDIFRLGCVFYRCVTGKAPFAGRDLPHPSRPAPPVAEAAPEVPEMLGEIIDQMIDPDSTRRPQKAAHVAKSLRVFLAAEEQAREHKAEEDLIAPDEKAAEQSTEEPEYEEGEEPAEEEAPTPRRTRRAKAPAADDGAWGKAVALWEEIQPELRDLLFLAGGALGMLLLIFLAELLTGIGITYIAGLVTGMAAGYCVDLVIRWRRRQAETASD